MPRKRSEFTRPKPFRDASLFVIACEGARTEIDYFQGVRDFIHSPRLKIEILERPASAAGDSSARHVLQYLLERKNGIGAKVGDQFWMVIDRDPQSLKPAMLTEVFTQANQAGCNIALSNPCFELWLLLHFENPDDWAEERRQELLENQKGLLKSLFADRLGGNTTIFSICWPETHTAMIRAGQLHKPNDRWPQSLGTDVHRLMHELLVTFQQK